MDRHQLGSPSASGASAEASFTEGHLTAEFTHQRVVAIYETVNAYGADSQPDFYATRELIVVARRL